jgi:hypothetical protein
MVDDGYAASDEGTRIINHLFERLFAGDMTEPQMGAFLRAQIAFHSTLLPNVLREDQRKDVQMWIDRARVGLEYLESRR